MPYNPPAVDDRALPTFAAFSYLPVTGHYRAPDDAFQLAPAPPEAPRPPAVPGDHPFLLQFPVLRDTDPQVTAELSLRALSECVWFLNATLKGLYALPPRRSRQMWVMCTDWSTGKPEGVRWASEGYLIPGFTYPAGPDFAKPRSHRASLGRGCLRE